jgi:hypothetical protein
VFTINDKKDTLSLSSHFSYFTFCFLISAMLLFYLSLFFINVIQIDSTLDSCRQTFGSNKYDLNRLSHLTILGDDALYRYALTPCGLISTDQCGQSSFTPQFEPGMTSCQRGLTGSPPRFESSMGFLDGYGKQPNIGFSENTAGRGTGVIMIMRNAVCNGGPRLVNVTFVCDKSIETPTKMEVVEAPACIFNIKISAAGACPISSGIAGGTVFIIILLVLIFVYLIGGVLYNRFKEKQTGLALLPHPTFWLLLVGLFLDGCRFTLSFIRTCGGGTSTQYASV